MAHNRQKLSAPGAPTPSSDPPRFLEHIHVIEIYIQANTHTHNKALKSKDKAEGCHTFIYCLVGSFTHPHILLCLHYLLFSLLIYHLPMQPVFSVTMTQDTKNKIKIASILLSLTGGMVLYEMI